MHRLLDVDGAAITLIHEGADQGTLGASGELSRQLGELQLTFGEGPAYDAVGTGVAVLVPDLADPTELRWPVFTSSALALDTRAVFALPISLSLVTVGTLDLFRHRPGRLDPGDVLGAGHAANLAVLPLLDLMTADADQAAQGPGEQGEQQLAPLERVEVYQATGMFIGAWDVSPDEALVRLRAHAFALGTTAQALASAMVTRTVLLTPDGWGSTTAGTS